MLPIVFIGLVILIVSIVSRLKNRARNKHSFIQRFRKSFKSRDRIKEKLENGLSNHLMSDPERNIKVSIWEEETVLRDKADIHRARLSRFGRSMFNEETFYMEKKGHIYRYKQDGSKEYI